MENIDYNLHEKISTIESFIRNCLNNNDDNQINQQHLYHYTDLYAFKSIIENHCLWATNVAYLNDPSEILHGIDTLFAISKKYISAKHEQFKELEETIEYIHSKFALNIKNYFYTEGRKDCFISCFSSTNNKLEMWNLYGKKQGICIEFNKDKLIKNMSSSIRKKQQISEENIDKSQPSIEFAKVFYGNKNTKASAIKKLLDDLFVKITKNADILKLVTEQNEKKVPLLLDVYFLLFYRIKHDCYSYENEYRIVIDDIKENIKFRTTDTAIIPYIEVDCGETLPITSIKIGPSKNPELVKHSVSDFLEIHGYKNVDIDVSDLPFRK